MPFKIGIIGSSGKLGQMLAEQINKEVFPVVLTANSSSWDEKQVPDIIVDVSTAAAVEAVVQYCAARQVGLIEGTSGLTEYHLSLLRDLAVQVPVLRAENFSVLHYLQCQLVEYLTRHLSAEIGFQLSVNERHTPAKKDVPSATAYKLARLCKRQGIENININYTRCGLPVSDHEIRLTLEHEELVIAHGVQNRAAAVGGIIKALHWLCYQSSGYYSMDQVYAGLKPIEDELNHK